VFLFVAVVVVVAQFLQTTLQLFASRRTYARNKNISNDVSFLVPISFDFLIFLVINQCGLITKI